MNRPARMVTLWLLSSTPTLALGAPPPPSAEYVLRATVKEAGAAASAGTAVVHVDEVIDGPEGAAELAGQEVTMHLHKGSAARAGAQRVFFANRAAVGATLELAAVDEAAPGDTALLKKTVAAARASEQAARLAAAVAASPLVIAGTVDSVAPERAREPAGEHDPLWREATVHVEALGKGDAGSEVVLYFPGSVDAAWAGAPRLTVGQKGVFILRSGAALARHAIKGPVLLRPEDLQPRDSVDTIRALLKRSAR